MEDDREFKVLEDWVSSYRNKEFKFLLDKIMRNRNIDFSSYKRATLERRIDHRLYVTGCVTYWDYIMVLNKDPQEYDRLIESLLIKVSGFFRDPKVFGLLGDMIIPEIISRKQASGDKKIRVWSCGAANGQEPYSTAVLFCEALGRRLSELDVRIIATDIDKDALEQAAWASYDRTAVRSVSPHLVFKYFTRVGDRYVVNDRAKSLVTFKYHDVIRGDTMLGMDLVLCRNLLIYFHQELQVEILRKLHTALSPGGFLVLGSTETIPLQMRDCFDVVGLGERIYSKN